MTTDQPEMMKLLVDSKVTTPIYRTRSIIDLDRSKIVQVLTLPEPANAAFYF